MIGKGQHGCLPQAPLSLEDGSDQEVTLVFQNAIV
jgi:hypothetical protein